MRVQSSLTGFSFKCAGNSIDVEFSDNTIVKNPKYPSFNFQPSIDVTVDNCSFSYSSLRNNEEKRNFLSTQIDNFFAGKRSSIFSDNDPEEPNTIIYICIPKNIYENNDIYIHENSLSSAEEANGSIAYALDLLLENDLFDIIMVEIEDDLL